jgi:hypothetical protein
MGSKICRIYRGEDGCENLKIYWYSYFVVGRNCAYLMLDELDRRDDRRRITNRVVLLHGKWY